MLFCIHNSKLSFANSFKVIKNNNVIAAIATYYNLVLLRGLRI